MVREPLPPGKQKRLEKIFEVANQKAAAAETPSDFDYATELFTQCVLGDPGNPVYLRGYLENLQKKYGSAKNISRLAQLQEWGARSALKKAQNQEHWDEVVVQGLKVLTANPWDVPTLTAMAMAAQKMGDRDCELCYLMAALKGSPKDPACNRLYALALADRGLLDEAIVFWRRVEEALPDEEEAKRAIASLLVEKARSSGRFEDNSELARKARLRTQQQEELTAEQQLQQKIQNDPQNLSHYLELAQFYSNDERFREAEELFAKAFEISDGDPDIREKWEDCQLRRLRQQMTKVGDPEERKKLHAEYLNREIAVYKNRVERYPNNLTFKYELGYRYMKAKRFPEAIQELQAAQNDPRRKGECLLALGECFRQIRQYQLAKNHYEAAIREIPDRDVENKKKALYLAGALSLGLKNLDAAEKHLTALAALDFHYKDVSALLDKLNRLRQNQDSAPAAKRERPGSSAGS